MSRKVRFAIGAVVGLVMSGTFYVILDGSTAEVRRPMAAQIDINNLTAGAKNLPVQQFAAF